MREPKAIENLLLYDPDFETYARGFREEYPVNGLTHAVTTPNELIDAVSRYTMAKNIELVLHGTPGRIWFNKGGLMVASYFGQIARAAHILAMDSRVLFLGCSIADGEPGDKFLSEVGKAMFIGTGGTVGGTTVTNFAAFNGGKMNPLRFFDAKLKVRRFDTSG